MDWRESSRRGASLALLNDPDETQPDATSWPAWDESDILDVAPKASAIVSTLPSEPPQTPNATTIFAGEFAPIGEAYQPRDTRYRWTTWGLLAAAGLFVIVLMGLDDWLRARHGTLPNLRPPLFRDLAVAAPTPPALPTDALTEAAHGWQFTRESDDMTILRWPARGGDLTLRISTPTTAELATVTLHGPLPAVVEPSLSAHTRVFRSVTALTVAEDDDGRPQVIIRQTGEATACTLLRGSTQQDEPWEVLAGADTNGQIGTENRGFSRFYLQFRWP